MEKNLVIYGTGGFAREVHEILERNTENYNFLGFLDDNELLMGTEVHGSRIIGGLNWLEDNLETQLLLVLGVLFSKGKLSIKSGK
ncbi:hypothetical protein MHI18_01370 [Peribacillus sp. FSL H8-0477]|uniref:PglD-related sugar-binding protein n=1 Tax=Peribacillus sp. FSL H8-0477 TaxID=2921388 RepID=UPI0030F78FD1